MSSKHPHNSEDSLHLSEPVAYHGTTTDHGDKTTFDTGGYYEAIDNGTPVEIRGPAGFCGYKTSSVPELAASRSPAAAAFSQLPKQNRERHDAITVHVYALYRDPDTCLCNTVTGDFSFLEEVRYSYPADNPLTAKRYWTVNLPSKAITDAQLTYIPPTPHIIEPWGDAVKSGISHAISTGTYPTNLSDWSGVRRPDPTVYDDVPNLLKHP